ncbi:MAG TPA: thioesterase family protein [Azospirillaceae bacterium]|nr:thioesterase family protein [Azospirillaceae bacterium]
MPMTPFTQVLAMADGSGADVPDDWSQGRAGFGGIVAALALTAARREVTPDWPLRSFTISFCGPAVGGVEFAVRTLRAGRTAAFIETLVHQGGSACASATFCFGPARPSIVALPPSLPMPAGPPEDHPAIPGQAEGVPAFMRHFEVRPVAGMVFEGSDGTELRWWVRHRDAAARGTEAGLVALLDTLPPAASVRLPRPAPMASLQWMADLDGGGIATDEGWYLLRSAADHAGGGFSGQTMTAWDRAGRALVHHRQSVGLFA